MSHGHCSRQPDGSKESLTYVSWRMMIQRCRNKNRKDYENYGGRGIKIYFDWLSPGGFAQFLLDVGERPSKEHSLDRIQVDGHYEPGNVRWSTRAVQDKNKSGNYIEFNGERLTTYGWAERLNLHPGALRKRFSRGYSKERALTIPNGRAKSPIRRKKNGGSR